LDDGKADIPALRDLEEVLVLLQTSHMITIVDKRTIRGQLCGKGKDVGDFKFW